MADWNSLKKDLSMLSYHLFGFIWADRQEWCSYRKRFLDAAAEQYRWAKPLKSASDWIDFRRAKSIRNSKTYGADFDAVSDLYKHKLKAESDSHTSALEAAIKQKNSVAAALAAAGRERDALKARESRLEARVDELENSAQMRLGTHILEESPCGVFELGRDGKVVAANRNACAYLGVEFEDIRDKLLSEVMQGEHYFSRYTSLFEASAEQLARANVRFKPNTLKIREVPFDIMAYSSNIGTRKMPVYGGGFVVISPFKPESILKKLLATAVRTTAHLEGIVTIETVLEECVVPLSKAGKRPFYIDFTKARSVSDAALNTMSKCYHAMKAQGVPCAFRNVPSDVAEYLVAEKNVEEKDIRRVESARSCLKYSGV